MARRSRDDSPAEMLLEILGWLFQIIPPWSCIPIGIFGFIVITPVWSSVIAIPPVRIMGVIFGAVFAIICFIAGWNGVRFREARMAFLGAEIDLNWVRSLTWRQFEQQLASVYRQNGYQVEETGGGGPDGGVDLRLFRDGRTTVVQCKHWKTWKVNVKPIRELFGVMNAERANAAIFITSGNYTSDALEFARGKPMELIDREGFLTLVRQFQRDLQDYYGYTPPQLEKSVTSESAVAPLCPICRSPMKLRTARKGGNIGSQFWGCSRFPDCRGTRNL